MKAGAPSEEMTGTCHSIPLPAGYPLNLHEPPISYRYRSRDGDRGERYSSKHRSREQERRGSGRDDRSARDSNRNGDRPRSREADGKSAAEAEDLAIDKSLTPAAVITEAPKQRPALKAGPAGGAYIPPFRLLQVSGMTHVDQHTRSVYCNSTGLGFDACCCM